MSKSNVLHEKWNAFYGKIQPGCRKVGGVCSKISDVFGVICDVCYRLRKLVLSVPVIYYAVKLALYNMEHLPETVGINLLASGEFAMTMARDMAVYIPLGITAFCLLMMLISRKVLYPWLISVISLLLPILLVLTNQYPA